MKQLRQFKCYKVNKGDEIVVLSGRSRGEIGKIEDVDRKTDRVYIAGKNLVKRHQKPDLQHQEGGIVDIPAPIHISNVAVLDPKDKKPTRVGFRIENGKKVRVAKRSGSILG